MKLGPTRALLQHSTGPMPTVSAPHGAIPGGRCYTPAADDDYTFRRPSSFDSERSRSVRFTATGGGWSSFYDTLGLLPRRYDHLVGVGGDVCHEHAVDFARYAHRLLGATRGRPGAARQS